MKPKFNRTQTRLKMQSYFIALPFLQLRGQLMKFFTIEQGFMLLMVD